MPIYLLTLNAVKSDADLGSLFLKLPVESPCVVVMEEIDVICPALLSRQTGCAPLDMDGPATSLMRSGITLSGLLSALDGVMGCHGRMVIATTNHPEVLDPALLRPGRIDLRVDLSHCSAQQAYTMFARYFGDAAPSMERMERAMGRATGVSPAQVNGVLLMNRRDASAALSALEREVVK